MKKQKNKWHVIHNTVNNIHTDQKLHMIEGSCWMCRLENQLLQLLDLEANQLKLELCVAVASNGSRGEVV